MKVTIQAMILFCSMLGCGAAFANADDVKWIAQCVKDNKHEGAKEEVVYKYCECMNNKMSDSETRSITEWEKSHPKEEAACSKAAGWK
jgi:hypothetical protein